jgi:predicted amidohydrolase
VISSICWPGDVLTHYTGGAPNIAGGFTNIVQDGKLLPAALAPKQRGVVFDVGPGMRAPPATAPFARGRCGGLAWADNPN